MLVLFETPAGFALFKVLDEGKLDKVEDIWKEFTTSDSARRVVELKAFNKFENTSDALSAATLIIDSKPSKGLRKFLQKHCEGETLAVADSKLGNAIKEKLKIDCLHNSAVMELMRGLRNQLTELITGLGAQELGPMSLGLSHSLSRYKLKFSPEKVDTMIIQAIGLLDDLDKELNTYAMRVREWYGWHFPELTKIVTDNTQYAKVVKMMGNRANAVNHDFSEILSDEEVESQIKEAAVISIGAEVSDLDLLNIIELCDQVLSLSEYRAQLFDYLKSRMNTIAPNLTALVGELVGARLIAHGGSLVNLAKQPGSTIQILGAEKALFRALKTEHSTPKYGLIYHASLIGKASQKNKGKISRSLAAKTALAIRCDALGDREDNSIGIESRLKLETRLQVLENKEFGKSAGSTKGKPKIEVYEKDRKKGAGALITPAKTYNPAADVVLGQSAEETPKKSELASKKRKHHAEVATTTEPAAEAILEDGDQERKKKKDKETEANPAADADGEKEKKKKSKESEEPAVAAAEGEKKKKKSDADGEDVAMQTEESGKKDKKHADDDEDERSEEEMWKADPVAYLGHGGAILVLFETLSGFALFNYNGVKLFSPNAIQNIWGEFVMEFMKAVWLKDFKAFEDKASVLNPDTGVTGDLKRMIEDSIRPDQKLAVGKKEYKIIIENSLGINCLYNDEVMELMWGIRNQMQYLLPDEKSKVTEEDCLPMCEGLRHLLNRYGFDVKPEMVNKSIIETAGLVYECDYNVNKHADYMRYAGEHLKKISDIDVEGWDLLKLATAFMILSYPKGEQTVAGNLVELFGSDYPTLLRDAPKYKDKLREVACFRVYKEMLFARKIRSKARRRLSALIRKARVDYEAQQVMRNHE